ncbi:hypothetical protein GCM10012285_59400 [Streptomyces kronopolitis]|uniref:Serine/arginine repetitive matrix protein 2 n=1 Tax=Streptomyces kronopolitis TaxID=1612435 RepID=A0ABQ2K1D6_9ACTN|nr:hypothetical protein [Streptomyces kronopolitis]GGN60891.1 hypothetical protein GCM10012285_59400 [Streptomyces kronopolitis]
MARGGQARWNNETQRWEDGTPPPAPYSGPMPSRPPHAPAADAATTGGPYPGPYPGPFPTSPPAPPPAPASAGPRRTALIAGAAVAAIAVATLGGYLLLNRQDVPPAAHPPSKASAPGTATVPSTGGPTGATGTPTPASGLPEGYRLVHDTKGFTLAVPGDWQRSERSSGVFYTAPDDRGLVQIFEITEPDTSPRTALEQASKGLSGNPGYEEISLGPLDGPAPGSDAAQLVYAYDSKKLGERVKVVDCAFTVSDGRQFAVLVLGTEANWPQQQRTQQIALAAFAPAA